MTEILQKNLSIIKDYNHELCDKINNFNALQNDIVLTETLLKEPNFTYNGIPIHSIDGAEKEAQDIFNKSEDSQSHLHIIYGLGLGYLFQEFAEKARGRVILYEPSIEMLRVTLEIVDFLPVLVKKNVFVASSFEDIKKIVSGVHVLGLKSKVYFLNCHKQQFSNELASFAHEINNYISIVDFNKKFEIQNNDAFLLSTFWHIGKKLCIGKPLSILADKCKNLPAVVVSAGPSLHENIEKLKKIKDKVVIFSVGTAFSELAKNGIIPDFLVIIERFDTAQQFLKYKDILPEINLICEPFTAGSLMELPFKNIFLNFSRELLSNIWLADIFDEKYDGYESKGTVSYCALNSAKILGCNPLILLGQDLSYREGNCYSENSIYHSLKIKYDNLRNKNVLYVENLDEYRKALYGKDDEPSLIKSRNESIQNKLDYLNSNLAFVESQNGTNVPTDIAFKLYIEYFKEFAKKYGNECKLINSSTGGAQIDGFENIDLGAIFENNFTEVHIEDIFEKISYKSDYALMLKKLINDATLCKNLLSVVKNAEQIILNYKRENKKSGKMTINSLKYLKAALQEFIFIEENFSSKNKLIESITLKEDKLVNKCLRESRGGGDYKSQMLVIAELEKYFINNDKKINMILPIFEVLLNEHQ